MDWNDTDPRSHSTCNPRGHSRIFREVTATIYGPNDLDRPIPIPVTCDSAERQTVYNKQLYWIFL